MGNIFVKHYKVMYNYEPRTFNDLKIRKGDRLVVSKFNKNGQWIKAKNVVTKLEGFVPDNFIAEEGSIQAEE